MVPTVPRLTLIWLAIKALEEVGKSSLLAVILVLGRQHNFATMFILVVIISVRAVL